MIGRPGVFALGLIVGVAAHSSYSCVRARAGDAFALHDDTVAPIDVPSAVSTPRLPDRPAPGPTDRLPSAAEGDIPKGGAPAIAPAPVPTGLPDLDDLRGRRLEVPVEGIDRKTLRDSFAEGRAGHVHEAIDILAPRGTPVVAVEDGRIEKLFTSKQGGLTIYQFDPSRRYCYYYAHLDRYAAGLDAGPDREARPGDRLRRRQRQRAAEDAAPALHDLQARRGQALVEGRANQPVPAMGRFLSAVAALLILAAAAPPRAAEKVPFAVRTRGLTFTEKVASLAVLPGAHVDLEIAVAATGRYRVDAKGGSELRLDGDDLALARARRAGPGDTLIVRDARGGKALELNVFVMVPFTDVQDGRLNGYRIGKYPAKTQPLGFVEVTTDTMRTKLSPHFELRQFLCKQPGGFPKYVVLSEALILKLERIIEALDDAGHDVDTLAIMSGYRTPFYNEGIGNVRDSQHTAGTAADIFVDEKIDGRMDDLDRDGVVTRDDAIWLFQLIDHMDRMPAALFPGGLGDYGATAAHGPFVHVDVRGRLARWRG